PAWVDLRVVLEQPTPAAVRRDAGLERAARLTVEPFAMVLAGAAVERQDERAAARVARIFELAGECRPQLGRGTGERREARRLGIGPEHARGCAGRAITRRASLEDADAQPTLLCAPCGRKSDDASAHDRRVVLLHQADDSVAA